MGWEATGYGDAVPRRQQSEAQRRKRELERQAKEQAKLSQPQQARLEVDRYENRLELLLSIHKSQGPIWEWHAIAASLPPPEPLRHRRHELKGLRAACLSGPGPEPDRLILEGRLKDQEAFEQARRYHIEELTRLAKLTTLARGVLAGDLRAYKEALIELNSFGEVAELGTTLHFSVYNSEFLGVDLKVKGAQVIPDEIKSLTSTGKLSVKRMPKPRFHEIYHDYVAGCMLRVAREVFALLPIKKVLITAIADIDNPTNESTTERPVLSVVIPRSALAGLALERLDPSDVIESFQHRGDFKASRKTGAFTPTVPFSPQEHMGLSPANTSDYPSVLASVQLTRQEVRASISKLNMQPPANPN